MTYPVIATSKVSGNVYQFIDETTAIVLKLGGKVAASIYKVGNTESGMIPPTNKDQYTIGQPLTLKEL